MILKDFLFVKLQKKNDGKNITDDSLLKFFLIYFLRKNLVK